MASLSDKILLLAHFFWRAANRGLIGFLFFYCLCFSMLWFILFQEQYVHVCVVEVQRKRQIKGGDGHKSRLYVECLSNFLWDFFFWGWDYSCITYKVALPG